MYDIDMPEHRACLLEDWRIPEPVPAKTDWELEMKDIRYFWSFVYPRIVGRMWREGAEDEWLWSFKVDSA